MMVPVRARRACPPDPSRRPAGRDADRSTPQSSPEVVASRLRATGSPEALGIVLARLRIIGDPTRVQIMVLLDRGGPATVSELADLLPCTYANTSRHLRLLHGAGLVLMRREGKHARYELADWTALWLVEQVATSVADHLQDQHDVVAGERPDAVP